MERSNDLVPRRELVPIEMDELRRLEASERPPRRGRWRISWAVALVAGVALAWHMLDHDEAQAAAAFAAVVSDVSSLS